MSSLSAAIFEGGPVPPDGRIAYGTAGFRAKATTLEAVMYRVGALAALRSHTSGSKAIGVVVTASHNPEPDNGVKIVDADGGMLAASWEAHATGFANARTASEVDAILSQIFSGEGGVPEAASGLVVIGMDTRDSSEKLSALVKKGVEAAGAKVLDMGLSTTPQVHWAVMRMNQKLPYTHKDYHQELARALNDVLGTNAAERPPLAVDCGNGVGARSLAGLVEAMGGVGGALTPLNTGEGGLNDGCGAEHVQKAKAFPAGVDAEASAASGTRFCSLDGDADRVVFFFGEKGSKAPVLLDGDKILILLASHIGSLLSDAGLASDLKLGVIQTAYANGASTDYLLSKLSPDCHAFAATGVKHLHHKALDYDIGAYFEANGHGTVIFNDKALAAIRGKAEGGNGSAKTLEALTRLINPAIGDAISDALAVEAVLSLKGWSLVDWASMYTDLPSRMTKELVKDRTLVKTVPDETKVVEPAELQVKIDELVSKVENGRCFVRPSGTEDCVRVYAEAQSQEAADKLAADVGKEVQRILN